MAVELGKFIPKEEKQLQTNINKAKKEIKKLVDGYNKSRSHEVDYKEALQACSSENSQYRDWCNRVISRQTVSNLLPTKTVLNFRHIFNPLFMNERVEDMRDLANLQEVNIKSRQGVGKMETNLILAMRNLAIAELRIQTSK
jgi:hypothetical protein